jgi:hypothetical protein
MQTDGGKLGHIFLPFGKAGLGIYTVESNAIHIQCMLRRGDEQKGGKR